jgi:hypothetical protein
MIRWKTLGTSTEGLLNRPKTGLIIKERSLSAELIKLKVLCTDKKISMRILVEHMNSRDHALITLFFSLPFFLPVPLPGLSILFGLIIAIEGVGMALNKRPWLPNRLLNKHVQTHILEKILDYGLKFSRGMEKFIRPRGGWIVRHSWIRAFNGGIIAICGILLALPLPYGTNFPPAAPLMLLSIASLEEDIFVMCFGYIAFIFNLAFFAGIFIFGVDLIEYAVRLIN